jgi:hypothetical protein
LLDERGSFRCQFLVRSFVVLALPKLGKALAGIVAAA